MIGSGVAVLALLVLAMPAEAGHTATIDKPIASSSTPRGQEFTFAANTTLGGCNSPTYWWNFDGTGSRHAQLGAFAFPLATTAGTRTITLTVNYTGQQHCSPNVVTRQVVIPNLAPTASLASTPASGTAGVELLLSGASSTDDGVVSTYRFTIDGNLQPDQASATKTQTFTAAGEHTVTLLVIDNDGASSSTVEKTIAISPGTVASVLVSPSSASVVAGVAEPFTATASDAHGNTVAFTPTWTTTCPGDAAVVSGSFTSTTVTATDCKVRATHDATGVFGESTVSVVTGPFAAYRMIPSVTTLQVGATLEVTAVPVDAFGNDVAAHASNEPESWGESCGLVTPTGAYTADYTAPTDLSLGSCTVTASHASATDGVTTLNLAGGTPVSLVVVPAHVYLAFGDSHQFVLEATDGFGNVYAVMPSFLGPFWSVPLGCGEVDFTGLYTAPMATDDCVVTAEYDGDAYMGTAHVNLDGSPPVPELPTIVLTLAGLVGLATFGGLRRFRRSG